MARRIEVRAIKEATFEGDQWEPIFHDETGRLIGFHAMGTNCSVFLGGLHKDWLGEMFKVQNDGRVFLQDGLAVLPDAELPTEVVIHGR